MNYRNSFFAFAFIGALAAIAPGQSTGDAALSAIRSSDRAERASKSKVALPPAEHLRRAGIYLANRLFSDARAHWEALVENYPNDPGVPSALRSEEHTSELQSLAYLVCRLLLEKKKKKETRD